MNTWGIVLLAGFLGGLMVLWIYTEIRDARKRRLVGQETAAQPATTAAAPKGRGGTWFLTLLFLGFCVWLCFNIPGILQRLGGNLGPDYRMIAPSIPAMESSIADYLSIAGLKQSPSADAVDGKAIVIDTGKQALHPLNRDIPQAIKAMTPDEVGAVVWIKTDYVYAFDLVSTSTEDWALQSGLQGQAPEGNVVTIPAYRAQWTVTVIDYAARGIRAKHTFVGPDPPSARVTIGQPTGSDQLIAYDMGKRVNGAEVLTGEGPGIPLADGRTMVGLVGPVPWDEALDWLKQMLGE
jgi:hypothetical protein